jgi:hypothetical protein
VSRREAALPSTRLFSGVRLAGLRRLVPDPAKGESFGPSMRVPDSGLARPRRRVVGRCAADERENFNNVYSVTRQHSKRVNFGCG